jgi:hypothetical protein
MFSRSGQGRDPAERRTNKNGRAIERGDIPDQVANEAVKAATAWETDKVDRSG